MIKALGKLVLLLAVGLGVFVGVAYVRDGTPPAQLVERVRTALTGGEGEAGAGAEWSAPTLPNGSLEACTPPEGFQGTRVLLIGNSLTYYSQMYTKLIHMADAAGRTAMVCRHTPGGTRFADHVGNAKLTRLLNTGGWDVVVLQEQSELPAYPWEVVTRETFPHALTLVNRTRAGSPGARIVLYQTPAHVRGSQEIPGAAGYPAMQRLINATYDRLGGTLGVEVARVGEAWERARRTMPNVSLYLDDRHPSHEGAYLIAAALHEAIFFGDPQQLPDLDIRPEVAEGLRGAVRTRRF